MTQVEEVTRPRVNLPRVTPDVYGALAAFTQAAGEGLDAGIAVLVKIRASQLNGCPFCIDMHTKEARAAGETEQRLYTLAAWRGTHFFSEREQAALALTEAVTLIADAGVPDDVYGAAAAVFDEAELAHLLWSIMAINAWNRLGVGCAMPPPGPAAD
jgi:AhpD family alkylhydroperoxidase